MNKLNIMLFREIGKAKGQFIAAAAVIMAGIVMFTATYLSYRNLKNSLELYYEQYRFLDYYAEASYIPQYIVDRVKKIDGVDSACGRISVDVGADVGEERRITLRIISLPEYRSPVLNRVAVISGGYFNDQVENSCLINQKFAEYNKLSKGGIIKAIIDKRIYELKIDGIVSSPEFIYAMKSADSLFSASENFGVIYIKETTAFELFGFNHCFNQLHIRFSAKADRQKIINRIERLLVPYGFTTGVERKDQLSNNMIENELSELENMAVMFPVLFLSVAAMIIYNMLRRIINNQRTQIGVLKSFGYSNRRIIGHYMGYAALIGLAGASVGSLLGMYTGSILTAMYTKIYNIPVLKSAIYWEVFLIGPGISMIVCLIAGFNSACKILSIEPAQAMRSETPKAGRRIFLEQISFIWNRLTFGWKMSLRNIFRSRQRAFLTLLGMAFTMMFFIISLYFLDAVDYLLKQHFFVFQKQDYKVTFADPSSFYDALELNRIKGVRKAEPVLEIPAQLINGWMKEDTMVVGLSRYNTFYRLTDSNHNTVTVPVKGILIAERLAEKLRVTKGETITLKTYQGRILKKDIKVAGTVKQYAGANCYMDLEELGGLLEEGRFANGALLGIENGMERIVRKEIFKIPGVETLESRVNSYRAFLQFMEFIYTFIILMLIFGSIMGFAIVFNTTVINITERRRELASLKVLGYTAGEIELTVFRENVCLGMLAILPGFLLGRIMCGLLSRMFGGEMITLEVFIYPKTYLITAISGLVFIIMAQLSNRKNITGLNMVEVLKNREG